MAFYVPSACNGFCGVERSFDGPRTCIHYNAFFDYEPYLRPAQFCVDCYEPAMIIENVQPANVQGEILEDDGENLEDGGEDSEDDSSTSPNHNGDAAHPLPAARVKAAPLPESLQPICVEFATPPSCPMPGCGVPLAAKDTAWRGHFKRNHHDELCLTPNCRGLAPSCKARCPFPLPDCKSCVGNHAGGGMAIQNVGRHLLNVHIKVAYRCPLCGVQKEWRKSACVRHIRQCVKKGQNVVGNA